MTTPAPSPRPAALDVPIKDMAEAAQGTYSGDADYGISNEDMRNAIRMALLRASDAGFVLIPRAELEEAADKLESEWAEDVTGCVGPKHSDLANRLRQRSRG